MPPMAVTNDTSLLHYYKQRVDDFEAERADLLRRVSSCSASASETHGLRCAAQKRAEEVRELQQALSAAHVHLFEERDRLLRLQADNDDLRLQEAEDRRRIQHLMSLTNPVDQEITLHPGSDPTSDVLFPRHSSGKPKHHGARGDASVSDVAATQRVLRTVYLPAANADSLQLKVESLQAQLTEQKQLASERVAALMQDRTLREQDEEGHRKNFRQQIEELTDKVKRMEDALRATTTDYIICRRDKQAAEARAAAAEDAQTRERSAASSKMGETKKLLEAKLERTVAASKAAAEEAAAKAEKQLKARELEASQLDTMHSAVKAELEQRVSELESKLSRAKDGWRQAEQRRTLDSEGFASDVTMLRQQLAAVDRKLHQMRLQSRLDDDERLDGLLTKIQSKGKPLRESNRQQGGSRGAAAELNSIKQGIQSIEERMRSRGKPGLIAQ